MVKKRGKKYNPRGLKAEATSLKIDFHFAVDIGSDQARSAPDKEYGIEQDRFMALNAFFEGEKALYEEIEVSLLQTRRGSTHPFLS
jgi:hypothetical protein